MSISVIPQVSHQFVDIDGLRVFYRSTGAVDAPALLLLHGFPSASHQFRRLIDSLGGEFRVIAPDYPGFGHSDAPPPESAGGAFQYSFDRLADVIERFCEVLKLKRFAMYVFDFGAPVGFRIALRHPEWISGLIVQNGNAYVEGLSPAAQDLVALRASTPGAVEKIREILTLPFTRGQYLTGAHRPEWIPPEGWTLDQHFLDLPGRKQIQVDLALDYHSNVSQYLQWQAWLRTHQPPTLILWGKNDPFFLEAGAHAYLQDLPSAQVHLLNAGHFALEEHLPEIASRVAVFMRQVAHAEGAAPGAEPHPKTEPGIAVINRFTVKADKLDEFVAIQTEALPGFRERIPGLRSSRFYRASDGHTAILISQFDRREHFEAFRSSKLFETHRDRLAPLLDRTEPGAYELMYRSDG
jgi:pimeloyl-ACP methyl ester carboxylesterase/heme-degrading monooxygenase HmoA